MGVQAIKFKKEGDVLVDVRGRRGRRRGPRRDRRRDHRARRRVRSRAVADGDDGVTCRRARRRTRASASLSCRGSRGRRGGRVRWGSRFATCVLPGRGGHARRDERLSGSAILCASRGLRLTNGRQAPRMQRALADVGAFVRAVDGQAPSWPSKHLRARTCGEPVSTTVSTEAARQRGRYPGAGEP